MKKRWSTGKTIVVIVFIYVALLTFRPSSQNNTQNDRINQKFRTTCDGIGIAGREGATDLGNASTHNNLEAGRKRYSEFFGLLFGTDKLIFIKPNRKVVIVGTEFSPPHRNGEPMLRVRDTDTGQEFWIFKGRMVPDNDTSTLHGEIVGSSDIHPTRR